MEEGRERRRVSGVHGDLGGYQGIEGDLCGVHVDWAVVEKRPVGDWVRDIGGFCIPRVFSTEHVAFRQT